MCKINNIVNILRNDFQFRTAKTEEIITALRGFNINVDVYVGKSAL